MSAEPKGDLVRFRAWSPFLFLSVRYPLFTVFTFPPNSLFLVIGFYPLKKLQKKYIIDT